MGGFLFEYGLFAAKTLTFIFLGLSAIIVILGIISSKQKNRATLEVEKINDKLNDFKEMLEEEIYSKEELKLLQKENKKKEKQEKKAKKQQLKENKNNPLASAKPKIFVIRFDGDLHASEVNNIRESITAVLSIAKQEDEILIVIESTGGVVHNYGLASSQLQRIKSKKIKLTCAVDLVAASGGYMMACVADHIIAAPFAIIGSIGVLAQVPNFHRLLDKLNVDIEHHTAGEYKSTLTFLGKNTKKAREKFCEELEDTHELFKKYVSQNRPNVDIDKIATGEHWYGSQAIELNLIDEIKTSDDYILEKSADSDIFEVSYKVNETFREKVSSLLHNTAVCTLETIWRKLQQNNFAAKG